MDRQDRARVLHDAENDILTALELIVQREFTVAVQRCNQLQERLQVQPLDNRGNHVNVTGKLRLMRGVALAFMCSWQEAIIDLRLANDCFDNLHFSLGAFPDFVPAFSHFMHGYALMGAHLHGDQTWRNDTEDSAGLRLAVDWLEGAGQAFHLVLHSGIAPAWEVRAFVLEAQVKHYLGDEEGRVDLALATLRMPAIDDEGMEGIKKLAVWMATRGNIYDSISTSREPWEAAIMDMMKVILAHVERSKS